MQRKTQLICLFILTSQITIAAIGTTITTTSMTLLVRLHMSQPLSLAYIVMKSSQIVIHAPIRKMEPCQSNAMIVGAAT